MANYPKIGIRPIIDGRRGPLKVRESLEDQTMNMAKAAAKLFTENLRYADGTPVQVVIADTTIGRVGETAACAEKFQRENVAVTLSVTPCWCYGSETMDMDRHTIKGVWGFNGTERPGAVYLAAVLAAHAQKGLPAFGIYGHDVQDLDDTSIPEDVKTKLLRFGRAAIAAAQMRGKSYLQIGSICMGIAGSIIDPKFIEQYLGMRVESVDEVEIIRRMTEGVYDKQEFEKALAWTKAKCKEGFDKNPESMQKSKEVKEEQWEFVVKMMVIIKDLMRGNPNLPAGCEEERVGHNAIAAGFQGQRQWTDFYPNADFAEALLNSSFDWNGKRETMVLATENDCLNGLGMLFEKLLTNRAAMFSDVRTYWSGEAVKRVTGYDIEGKAKEANGFLHLINSGASALDFNLQARDEAPMTMIRLNLVEGLGPMLQIAEGWSLCLPQEVTEKLWKRTDYTWPCTWFAPRCSGKGMFKDAYTVMNNWGANHGAIAYGHIGADLITLASILRIPVAGHNVPEEDIFRPSCWNAFGMDKEGQDFRACKNYGPLFK